eukprot:scaffold35841_cov46-Phaeocystis_antarctica.AAC.3
MRGPSGRSSALEPRGPPCANARALRAMDGPLCRYKNGEFDHAAVRSASKWLSMSRLVDGACTATARSPGGSPACASSKRGVLWPKSPQNIWTVVRRPTSSSKPLITGILIRITWS